MINKLLILFIREYTYKSNNVNIFFCVYRNVIEENRFSDPFDELKNLLLHPKTRVASCSDGKLHIDTINIQN